MIYVTATTLDKTQSIQKYIKMVSNDKLQTWEEDWTEEMPRQVKTQPLADRTQKSLKKVDAL